MSQTVENLFVEKTTCFCTHNFCDAEEEWVGHGVKDQEVRYGNDVYLSLRSMEEPVQGVKSLFFRGSVPVGRCGLAGIGSLNDH